MAVGVTKRELLVNNAVTTLDGSIDDSVTTITVASGAVFPATGNFRILIGSEIMKATARSTNDLTVERGVEGTVAASHTSGLAVVAIVTAGSLKQYMKEASPFYRDGNTPTRITDSSGAALDSSDFTWDNQGSATAVDDARGNITIKAPDNASAHGIRMLYKTADSAPNVTRALLMFGPGYETETHNSTRIGIAFRESDTGKIFAIEITPCEYTRNASEGGHVRVMKYTDSTTVSSEVVQENFFGDRVWLEIENDDTDVFFRLSFDDDFWDEVHTEAKGTFMASAGPDQIGFYINAYDAFADVATPTAWMHLLGWRES